MTGVGNLCHHDEGYQRVADGATEPGMPPLTPRPPRRLIEALVASHQTVKAKAASGGWRSSTAPRKAASREHAGKMRAPKRVSFPFIPP